MELILATESKFKIDIFKQEGFKVRAQASSEAEHYHDRSDPTKYVKEISRVKALSVARGLENGIVIGTDVVAVLDNVILEKPKDLDEVRKNMKMLQGRTNFAISGITIIDITRNISITVSEITKVTFREMTDEEIEEYIENVPNVLKCAGYSVGGYGKKFVSGIEGDYNNIFGAPIDRINKELKNLGLNEE